MKHNRIIEVAAIAAAVALVPTMASAQHCCGKKAKKQSGSQIELVNTAENAEVKDILKKDRPSHPKDIPTPKFAIRTADNAFVMSIGGQINTIVGADLGNDLYEQSGAGGGFVTSQIPVPSAPGKKADTFINPLNANFDIQVVGLGGTDNQITGYMQFGTNGTNQNMMLKKAYVTWKGITAGLKSTLMQDSYACQPPTIDPEGPNAEISNAAYEVSYTSPSYGGFRYAIGLDIPTFYSSNGIYRGHDYKVWHHEEIQGQPVADPTAYNQLIPDVPMWIEYAASPVNRIRLSGVIRNFEYRDILAQQHRNTVGWGTMLSGNLSPVDPLVFYGTVAYGKGIGNYIQDIAGIPVSFVPSNDKPGQMNASPMMSWMGGVTYNINSDWQVNGMISQVRLWDVEPYAVAASSTADHLNNYKKGLYVAGNVFYNVSSYFQVGAEYLYGQRTTWNSGSAADNRVQMQLMFTF